MSYFSLKQNNNFVVRQAFARFYHAFFWSEGNVVLNYFPPQDGVLVLVCPLILIRHMTILNDFMADVNLLLIVYIALANVIAKITVADLIALFMADVIAIMCVRW